MMKNVKIYYLKFKKKVFNHLASQLANVFYSIKHESKLPLRYPLIWMSMSGALLRFFVTKDVITATFFSGLFASLMDFLTLYYILCYILPNEERMKMIINFIKNHREDPEIK
jgi:hypothetical protein